MTQTGSTLQEGGAKKEAQYEAEEDCSYMTILKSDKFMRWCPFGPQISIMLVTLTLQRLIESPSFSPLNIKMQR